MARNLVLEDPDAPFGTTQTIRPKFERLFEIMEHGGSRLFHTQRLLSYRSYTRDACSPWQLAEEHRLALERQAEEHHRDQGPAGKREPACCQILVIMDSILMMIIKQMTMTVTTVPLATCCLLFATTAKDFHFARPPH